MRVVAGAADTRELDKTMSNNSICDYCSMCVYVCAECVVSVLAKTIETSEHIWLRGSQPGIIALDVWMESIQSKCIHCILFRKQE